MDLRDSPEQAAFRARLRAWIAENMPERPPQPPTDEERHRASMELHRRLYEAGWIALSLPLEVGGQGLGPVEEAIYNEEMSAAEGNWLGVVNVGYIARAFYQFGTDEQKETFLRPLLEGRHWWCQGFSEPGAGSDLAGLQTRAVDAGDHFLVTGQKIWTSTARFADYCFLLCRTDPEAPKHQGISVLLVDMTSPGITVREIRQINEENEFAEVFFDDVVVPRQHLLGGLNQGWPIAMWVLGYERGPMDIGFTARQGSSLRRLAAELAARDAPPETWRELARAAVACEVLRMHCLRGLSRRMNGEDPGSESSVDKLLLAHAEQKLYGSALGVLGPAGLVTEREWFNLYLYSRASSIYGGTSQIQKNVLATRVLGLPR